jgi:hypothetical protein
MRIEKGLNDVEEWSGGSDRGASSNYLERFRGFWPVGAQECGASPGRKTSPTASSPLVVIQ